MAQRADVSSPSHAGRYATMRGFVVRWARSVALFLVIVAAGVAWIVWTAPHPEPLPHQQNRTTSETRL